MLDLVFQLRKKDDKFDQYVEFKIVQKALNNPKNDRSVASKQTNLFWIQWSDIQAKEQ